MKLSNIFKKKQQPIIHADVQEVLEAIPNTHNYPKEVLQIHHEFNMAAEVLAIEAKKKIDKANECNISKIESLKDLGFKQAKEVEDTKDILEDCKLSQEQLSLLAIYQFRYPNNKFITEGQVKTICHKYNLVCATVNRYKGFVPQKNIEDIKKFKLKSEDIVEVEATFGGTYYNKKDMEKYHASSDFLSSHRQFRNAKTKESLSIDEAENFGSLKICAPIKDMDIKGLELIDGYKLQAIHIPDPVVLQPVAGGYLILTAWGDEASDPLVVNNKFN